MSILVKDKGKWISATKEISDEFEGNLSINGDLNVLGKITGFTIITSEPSANDMAEGVVVED